MPGRGHRERLPDDGVGRVDGVERPPHIPSPPIPSPFFLFSVISYRPGHSSFPSDMIKKTGSKLLLTRPRFLAIHIHHPSFRESEGDFLVKVDVQPEQEIAGFKMCDEVRSSDKTGFAELKAFRSFAFPFPDEEYWILDFGIR